MINTWLILGACTVLAVVAHAEAGVTKADEEQVRSVVTSFARAADTQDVAQMRTVLHKEAQQFFKGPDGMVRLETQTYLQMIEQKKIGGQPRDLAIASIDVNGDLASVKASMTNESYHFDNYISLMKVGADWQIVSIVLRMEAK